MSQFNLKGQILDLDQINQDLRDCSPQQIVEWALSLDAKLFATSSFGPQAGALLQQISPYSDRIPVVWIDHGFNVEPTLKAASELIEQLGLNIKLYRPQGVNSERIERLGLPSVDKPDALKQFTYEVKIEPFSRALQDLDAQVWLTGIRKEETPERAELDILSIDARGLLKVAPYFYWTAKQVDQLIEQHRLPRASHYYDPTKQRDNRECGMHLAARSA